MLYKGLVSGLFSLLLVGCGGEPAESTNESEATSTEARVEPEVSEEPEAVKEVKQGKTFGITPKEFGQRLSAEAKEVGLGDATVGEFKIDKGEVNDVFTELLSEALAVNGIVDKNGELKSVTYIMGKTENGDTEIMNMIMMAGLTARALSPDLTKEETAGEVVKLMTKSVEDFGSKGEAKNSKVVGNVKYTTTVNQMTGLWIIFEPAE